jgi:Flp pilus assembly pilin Flp
LTRRLAELVAEIRECAELLRRRESAQTMAEYAVMLGVISAGLVLALTVFSDAVSDSLLRVVKLFPK